MDCPTTEIGKDVAVARASHRANSIETESYAGDMRATTAYYGGPTTVANIGNWSIESHLIGRPHYYTRFLVAPDDENERVFPATPHISLPSMAERPTKVVPRRQAPAATTTISGSIPSIRSGSSSATTSRGQHLRQSRKDLGPKSDFPLHRCITLPWTTRFHIASTATGRMGLPTADPAKAY